MNWLKYLRSTRYLHVGAGILLMLVSGCSVALVLHQFQHHQFGEVHTALALTGALVIGACGLGLTAIYLRP